MDLEGWAAKVPQEIKGDALWKITAYRLALYCSDLGWQDASRLMKDRRTWSLADQLLRSLGSVSANIAKGYSRRSGRDRARFYEYALGSARESRDWYFKARRILTESVSQHRIQLLTNIIRLLLKMIPQQRGRTISESRANYRTAREPLFFTASEAIQTLADLLHQIPMSEP